MANTTNFAIEKPQVGGYRSTWGSTLNVALDRLSELLALALPVGTIQIYPKTSAPAVTQGSSSAGGEWKVCDASAISRQTYSDLFGVIGETYGAGDGSSTFNLPDLRCRVPVGYNIQAGLADRGTNAVAQSGGKETHALSVAELASHSHGLDTTTHTHAFTTQDKATGITETNLAKSDFELNDHAHSLYRFTDYIDDEGVSHGGSGKSETLRTYLGDWRTDVSATVTTHPGADLKGNDGAGNNGHKHSLTDPGHQHTGTTDGQQIGFTATQNAGSGTPHENRQPFIVLNYIILCRLPVF